MLCSAPEIMHGSCSLRREWAPWWKAYPAPQRRRVLPITRDQHIWCCDGALHLIMALGLVYVVSCLNLKRLLSKTSLSALQGIIVIYINNGVYLLFQLLWFKKKNAFPSLPSFLIYVNISFLYSSCSHTLLKSLSSIFQYTWLMEAP